MLTPLFCATDSLLPPPPVYLCLYARDSIRPDGILDEPVWQRLDSMELVDVEKGALPEWPTTAKAFWDSTNLYVSMIAYDNDIWAMIEKRDGPLWEEEILEMSLDVDDDMRNYVEFEWNCMGAVLDYLWFKALNKGGAYDSQWKSPGMQYAIQLHGTKNNRKDTDTSMVLEVILPWVDFVPLSVISLPPKHGDSMLVNFCRYERPKGKPIAYTAAAAAGTIDFHVLERFATMVMIYLPEKIEPSPASPPVLTRGHGIWILSGIFLVSLACGGAALWFVSRPPKKKGRCGRRNRSRSLDAREYGANTAHLQRSLRGGSRGMVE